MSVCFTGVVSDLATVLRMSVFWALVAIAGSAPLQLLQVSRTLLRAYWRFLMRTLVSIRLLFRSVSRFLFHSHTMLCYQVSDHCPFPISQSVDCWVSGALKPPCSSNCSLFSVSVSLFLSPSPILNVNYFKSFGNDISHLLSHCCCQVAPCQDESSGFFRCCLCCLGSSLLDSRFSVLHRLFPGDPGQPCLSIFCHVPN